MADHKKMYSVLFNAVTDAINILQRAQQQTEELFISTEETVITVLEKSDADRNVKNKT